MANKKVVVDPVTRIEGHLRMQAVLDENNVIVDAMSTGTMWRGLEVILEGTRPRDGMGLCGAHLRRLHRYSCFVCRSARLKMLSELRFRRTPISSAT